MQNLLIVFLLFCIVIVTDLVPLFRKKELKYLYFIVPVYLLTLALNIMTVFDAPQTSIFSLIRRMLSNFIK